MSKLTKQATTKLLPKVDLTQKRPPPKGWEELYLGIREARKTIDAPVDTVGCFMLKDPTATKEVQRYQTLLALMLSSQTRDQCTAQAMQQLIAYNKCTIDSINSCSIEKIKELIACVCFYNNKAKYIKATTNEIVTKHSSVVPYDYNTLVGLPGLGPKMVHLFLQSDGVVEGIGVDVHVHRLSKRFDWVPKDSKSPEHTRKYLESWLPQKYWSEINVMLVGYGQTVCPAVNPKCGMCAVNNLCPNAFKESKANKSVRSSSPIVEAPIEPEGKTRPKKTILTETLRTQGKKAPLVDMEELCTRLKWKL